MATVAVFRCIRNSFADAMRALLLVLNFLWCHERTLRTTRTLMLVCWVVLMLLLLLCVHVVICANLLWDAIGLLRRLRVWVFSK